MQFSSSVIIVAMVMVATKTAMLVISFSHLIELDLDIVSKSRPLDH